MFSRLLAFDAGLASTRGLWLWVGQLAVVLLGVHLAADRLDDLLLDGLLRTGLVDAEADWPGEAARWVAVLLELGVIFWAFTVHMRGLASRVASFAEWRARASLEALVRPLFWAPVSASGAWVIAMAVEDSLAPWWPVGARGLGAALGAMAAWRLAATGAWKVALAVPPARTALQGWWWAPAPLGFAALAVWRGLPIWGLA